MANVPVHHSRFRTGLQKREALLLNIMSDKEYLKEAARAVESKLPDNHGFILLVTPFGEGDNNRLTYISSMKRADALNVLKEFLIRSGAHEDWMKHLD